MTKLDIRKYPHRYDFKYVDQQYRIIKDLLADFEYPYLLRQYKHVNDGIYQYMFFRLYLQKKEHLNLFKLLLL